VRITPHGHISITPTSSVNNNNTEQLNQNATFINYDLITNIAIELDPNVDTHRHLSLTLSNSLDCQVGYCNLLF
jgi:hypothetical protein